MAAAFLASRNTEDETPEEITPDNPQSPEQSAQIKQFSDKELDDALLQIRSEAKQSWRPKRDVIVRKVLKSFQYLKGDPYSIFDPNSSDPINLVLTGQKQPDDPDLYQFNDNVYQMLNLSFMAALGPDVAKVRWQPNDPDDESDLKFSKKASTMNAEVERKNDYGSLGYLEMLYFFNAGHYFGYVRNVVDAVRAGTTKQPVYAMQDVQVFPDRYLCPKCGTPQPAKQYSPFVTPSCFDCQAPLGQKDWYPAESMPMPVQVDEVEQPNSMTAVDIFCILNIDADPDAQKLPETPLLDLEGELDTAAVRAMYPERYEELCPGDFEDGENGNNMDRLARERVTSPTNKSSLLAQERKGSFSRCWIQPWAFYSLKDKALADRLVEQYPKGVKLVTYGNKVVLEKRPESLLEKWTHAAVVPGMGLFPFGVGHVALSLQDRVDDTANTTHIYMDRMALPPVLANAALIDVNALGQQRWGGGRAIPVYPAMKTPGMRFNLNEAVYQPTFHADSQIYSYSQTLIMLMQLLTGIQPQIFGGGTQKGVDTATGQEQMLNTAMGRLMMFLTFARAEKARRGRLAVKCMAADIDGQKRITVPGAVDDQYENVYILEDEVQGDILAYPDPDQGFPAGYSEMRDRMVQLLGMIEKNPILQNMLSEPDMQKMMARYLLPDGATLPNDEAISKTKLVLQQLSAPGAAPLMVPDPTSGQMMPMPSIMPDQDFDNFDVIVKLAMKWGETNYEMATTNPNGYANVRAYLRMASMMAQKKAAAAAAVQAAAGAPPDAGDAGGA